MKTFKLAAIVFAFAYSILAHAQAPVLTQPNLSPSPTLDLTKYSLQPTISDEFSGPLKTSLWCDYDMGVCYPSLDMYVPRAGDPNGIPPAYSFGPASDGSGTVIKMSVKKQPMTLSSSCNGQTNYNYTGVVLSSDKSYCGGSITKFKYGYYEIRAKLPANYAPSAQAYWFWSQSGTQGTPTFLYSELDVFETTSDDPTDYPVNTHFGNGTDGSAYEFNDNYTSGDHSYIGFNLARDFHTFGVDWTPTSLDFYIDGIKVKSSQSIFKAFNCGQFVPVSAMEPMWAVLWHVVAGNNLNRALIKDDVFEIDYYRVYKKRPVITENSINCKSGTQSYTATTGIVNDNITWTVDPVKVDIISQTNNLATGSSTVYIVVKAGYVNSPGTLTATASGGSTPTTCTASSVINISTFNSKFTVGNATCSGSTISLPVAAEFAASPGHEWVLYPANSSGTITGAYLQRILSGSSATFNSGLVNGGYYVIKHGTFSSCIDWSETQKFIQINLSDFTYTRPICLAGNGLSTTVAAKTTTTGSDWRLYASDAAGNKIGAALVTTYGNSATFNNLNPNSYYVVQHGIYSSGCQSAWQQTEKIIYVLSYDNHNADFTSVITGPPSNYTCTSTVSADETEDTPNIACGNDIYNRVSLTKSNQWVLYNSNSNGDELSVIGSAQWGTTAIFTGLLSSKYYIIKHGVWSSCSQWQQRRYLVFNSTVTPKSVNGQDSIAMQLLDDNLSPQELDSINNAMANYYNNTTGYGNDETIGSDSEQLTVYPNPNDGLMNVRYYALGNKSELTIINMLGQIIYNKPVLGLGANSVEINLTGIANGIYTVKFYDGYSLSTKKIIVSQ